MENVLSLVLKVVIVILLITLCIATLGGGLILWWFYRQWSPVAKKHYARAKEVAGR